VETRKYSNLKASLIFLFLVKSSKSTGWNWKLRETPLNPSLSIYIAQSIFSYRVIIADLLIVQNSGVTVSINIDLSPFFYTFVLLERKLYIYLMKFYNYFPILQV